eukprot:gene17964-20460_t
MSNQADSRVGSVALWNNNAYVLVSGYDKKSKTCTVTALERPEHVSPAVVPPVVEAAAVEFFPPKSFAKRFPNPTLMDGHISSGADRNLYGTAIDVSMGVPEDLLRDGVITINTSCAIKGTPQPFQGLGNITPVTCVDFPVAIHLDHPNDIVEFADIHFRGNSSEHDTILCTAGKTIVFRKCQFSSSRMFAVHVISKTGSSTSKKLKSINVIFENCVFTTCASRPLLVEYPGKVLLLNSTFTNNTKNTSDGSAIFDGGSVVARHLPLSAPTVKNRNIKSGPKCLLTVDGEVLPPPPLKLIIAEAKKNLDMFELDQMRRNKKAGVGPVICFHCQKVEPKLVRFKKCGRCKSAYYCSRECQVAHWPDGHRDMCYMEVEPEGGSEDAEGKGEDEEDGSGD